MGEGENDDKNTQQLIKDIVAAERPDIAVVTGDSVSGYEWDNKTSPWTALLYKKVTDTLTEIGMPWAMTAGNHDTEGDLSREELSAFDRSHELSMTKPNAA